MFILGSHTHDESRVEMAPTRLVTPPKRLFGLRQLQPEVPPQLMHFMHDPLRTSVKLPHESQASPS